MKKLFTLLILLFLWAGISFAQVSNYTFASSAGAYTPLATETILWSASFDDNNSVGITIPSMTVAGAAYTTMFVQANGWITLGGTLISSSYTPISQGTSYPVVISAFGRDLNNAAAGTPKISYNTNDGGEIVVQYQDVRRYAVTGEMFSFQIRLKPSTGDIKFVYGGTITGGTSTSYPQVGLRGSTNAVYNNRTTTTDWAATTAGASNTATCLMSTTVTPTVGLTYMFSPPTIPALFGNPGTLSLGYAPSGGYSTEQTYSLSGNYLTGSPIAVTAPAGFEVSLTSGFGFGSSVDVSFTPPTLASTTIFTRFAPSASNTDYSGNITHVGGGASANVAVTGSSYEHKKWCTSNATSTADEEIFNITVGTINNTSDCSTTAPGAGSIKNQYSNYFYDIAPADLQQGSSNAFSVQIGTCGTSPYSNAIKIFIDFNQDGDFADAGEQVYVSAASSSGAHTETGNITVPAGATLGNTMMRVVNVETSSPSSIAACGTYSWGETEDYKVNIIAPPNYQLSWYNLQWPPTAGINQTENVTVYSQCWESGVTEAAGPGIGIVCWIGYSTTNTNPNTWTNWVATTYNFGIDPSNNDEYMANLGAAQGLAPGTYYFASRYQYLGGVMTYGGYNAGGGGPWDGANNVSGVLTVTPYAYPLTFTENFDLATLPAYWSQTYSGGVTSNRWNVNNTANAGGTAYEMRNSYANGIGISRLITPAINTSTAINGVYMAFNSLIDDYGPGATFKIQTSTDLTNWTDESWSYVTTGNVNVGPGVNTLQILNNISAATYIAFVIEGDHYQYDYWYIDNVIVKDGPFPIPGLWVGTVDNDWDKTGNWSDGVVPTIATDVTIPAGCPNYPNIVAPAACNKLTIANGGSMFIIDSFFDVFTDISCSGILDISGGITTATGNLYIPAATGTLNMSSGRLDIASIFKNAAYTWSNGTYQLSGGTINTTGSSFFYGGTGSTMSGSAVFNVGGTLQLDNTMWTMTGGTINLLGTEASPSYFLPPTGAGTAVAFNLNVNSGAGSYVFSRDAYVNQDAIVNDFTIQSGTVNLANLTGYPSTFSVGGNLTVAASNTANLTIPAATNFTVQNVNQYLKSAAGYGSIIGEINHTGQYNFNVEIEGLATGRWQLISPPVAGLSAAMFNCQYLMRHDPITNSWIDMTPTEPLLPGVDYAVWIHPDPIVIADPICGPQIAPLTTYTYSGLQNFGPITVPLLNNGTEGWNNVGNPYQSAIDWDALTGWTKTNINNAIYLENNGVWATYIAGVGLNGGSRYIAPAQGFFVDCLPGGGTLGFDNSIQTHTRATFFKNSIANMVKLQASGNGRTDETVVRFTDDATDGFDGDFDAHKIYTSVMDNPDIPQIYSTANGNMAINSLPETETVALGFKAGIEGSYLISAIEISDLSKVDLEDLSTGSITNLLNDSYSFNYKPGENEQRFILHFAPLSVNEAENSIANIYALQRTVYVNLIDHSQGNVYIYNISGQLVATAPASRGMNKVFLRQSGNYIVKVITEKETLVKKVWIQ